MMIVMYLKENSKAFKMFKCYLASLEKETGKNMKSLRFDRGGEFTSHEFELFCNDKGIKDKPLPLKHPLKMVLQGEEIDQSWIVQGH